MNGSPKTMVLRVRPSCECRQVERDIVRTFPGELRPEDVPKLRRVLLAYAAYNTRVRTAPDVDTMTGSGGHDHDHFDKPTT
jgi:hypothetical protein